MSKELENYADKLITEVDDLIYQLTNKPNDIQAADEKCINTFRKGDALLFFTHTAFVLNEDGSKLIL